MRRAITAAQRGLVSIVAEKAFAAAALLWSNDGRLVGIGGLCYELSGAWTKSNPSHHEGSNFGYALCEFVVNALGKA